MRALRILLIAALPLVSQTVPEKKEAAKWDVNNPPGPTEEVPIRTSSGTWMSVDVSPQGDEIVFDLLGDIYVMPFSGGKAKAIASGMAWDMQPRYSQPRW